MNYYLYNDRELYTKKLLGLVMSEGIPYADILILALIAGFILLRLRSVLGSKSEGEPPAFRNKILPAAEKLRAMQDTIVQLDEKSLKQKPKEEADPAFNALEEGPLAKTLADIKAKDPQFSLTRFMEGAKAAFEMVFDAFAKGDQTTLKMLMTDDIFKTFNAEIAARAAQPDHKHEVTLVSVAANGVTHAVLEGSKARLTVHFTSEQVNLVRNANNDIIEGDPSELHHVEDDWTFERDITSKNPNWKIIET